MLFRSDRVARALDDDLLAIEGEPSPAAAVAAEGLGIDTATGRVGDAVHEERNVRDDLEARAQLLQEAELIMIEELPLMPIYFYVSNYLVKPWVGGYETNIMKHDRSKNFYILSH